MKCEICGSKDTFVTDSRWKKEIETTRRRYKCRGCGERFFTQELYEDDYPYQHNLKRFKMARRKKMIKNQLMSDKCSRCRLKKPGEGFSMSIFNIDWICSTCKTIEKSHPDYKKAKAVETKHVLNGNYNFEGIGLPDDWEEHIKNLLLIVKNYCPTE